MTAVFLIAEAGVNHNGSLSLALRLADAALACGADAVKFQTFRAEDVVTPSAQTAEYQRTNTGATNQFDMIKQLELSDADHLALAEHCKKIGIEFFSTPFSEAAVDLLISLGVARFKLPSGEITNKALIQKTAASGLPLLMSSGMSTLAEVIQAVAWITEARLAAGHPAPTPATLSLLHCTSAYPAPANSLNLRAMQSMAEATGLPVGYSDHSLGIEAAMAAVAMGASLIEKHLTLDKTMDGPDHLASCDPEEFSRMAKGIRLVEQMRGDGIKRPQAIEANTRDVARRSVVVIRDLPEGHVLCAADLALRRPGTGIAPELIDALPGRVLASPLSAFTTLEWAQLVGGPSA